MTSRNRRLLVADEDEDIRTVVADLLFDQGFEICQATNADEAFLWLKDGEFDVLLCHLALLRAGRGRLIHRTREQRPRLRVVATSADGAQAVRDEADATLAKPFTRSQLLAALLRS